MSYSLVIFRTPQKWGVVLLRMFTQGSDSPRESNHNLRCACCFISLLQSLNRKGSLNLSLQETQFMLGYIWWYALFWGELENIPAARSVWAGWGSGATIWGEGYGGAGALCGGYPCPLPGCTPSKFFSTELQCIAEMSGAPLKKMSAACVHLKQKSLVALLTERVMMCHFN